MNKIFFIINFLLLNTFSQSNDKKINISQDSNENKIKEKNNTQKKKNNFFFKKLIKTQKILNYYEHGHDLTKKNTIKIGMNQNEIIKILGQPLIINPIKNTYYYISAVMNNSILGIKHQNGNIVRLSFKNKKLESIKIIDLKKDNISMKFIENQKNLINLKK